jgi:hypothetical protein
VHRDIRLCIPFTTFFILFLPSPDIDKLRRADTSLKAAAGDGPRRTLYVVQQCLAARARRPLADDDTTVHAALQAERAGALGHKLAQEAQMAANTHLMRECAVAMDALQRQLEQELRPLALSGEQHSGSVLHYARPQGEPPATVQRLRELSNQARAQTAASLRLCKQVAAEAHSLAQAVDAALKQSIAQLQRKEVRDVEGQEGSGVKTFRDIDKMPSHA